MVWGAGGKLHACLGHVAYLQAAVFLCWVAALLAVRKVEQQ